MESKMNKPVVVNNLNDLNVGDKIMRYNMQSDEFEIYDLIKIHGDTGVFLEQSEKDIIKITSKDWDWGERIWYLPSHKEWLIECLRYQEWMNAYKYARYKKHIEDIEEEAKDKNWSLEIQ